MLIIYIHVPGMINLQNLDRKLRRNCYEPKIICMVDLITEHACRLSHKQLCINHAASVFHFLLITLKSAVLSRIDVFLY